MCQDIKAKIISTGSYLPERVMRNDELKQFPENSYRLIELKTGIKERRHVNDGESTSDLAVKAARKCLEKVEFNPTDIEAIILATSSPDRIQPATATRVQHEIGASNAFAFDINSVCSGSVFGIYLADALIKADRCDNVLLIASEVYSRLLNPDDFSTFPYFGDGAGAALFYGKNDSETGVISSLLKTDGSGADLVQVPAGGFFQMDGKAVYNFATNKAPEIINELLTTTGIGKDEIKYVISHQANINIIKEISLKTGIALDKFIINLDKYGNTAAASILIGLDELYSSAIIQEGDLVLTVGFGGGLSWGANLISLNKISKPRYTPS